MKKILSMVSILGITLGTVIISCSGDSDSADSGNSTSTTGGGASDNAVGTTGAASVAATDVTACGSVTGVSKIVCLTEQLKATLTSSQLAALQLDYTYANIKTWSNLPAAMSARKGIPLGNLNATQVGIAKAIIKEMSGTAANEGYDEIQQLLYADNYLNANGGGSTYGSGNFYLAFFGTPSATGKFEIMFTGHHKTIANTYNNGALVAATPLFTATEPLSFAVNSTTYAPMDQEKNAIVALLGGLSSTQLATAKASTTFTDLVCGPNANWSFPTAFSGLQCSALDATQKALVLNVIKTYVNDVSDTNAASILATYTSELDNTYIYYSGNTSMTVKNDYFRIAGPKVWIEFSVQGGIVLSGVHYHSIWRDRVNDYATTNS